MKWLTYVIWLILQASMGATCLAFALSVAWPSTTGKPQSWSAALRSPQKTWVSGAWCLWRSLIVGENDCLFSRPLTIWALQLTQSQAPLKIFCLPVLDSGTENRFINLVLEVIKLCILMKEGSWVQPTSFSYSHVPQSEQISLVHILQISPTYEQAQMLHTQEGFSWGVCWWGQWSGSRCCCFFIKFRRASGQDWTERQCGNDSFRLFDAENTAVTPQIFLSLSFTNCWKMVNEWYLLKVEHSVACSSLMCEKFGGSTLCRIALI